MCHAELVEASHEMDWHPMKWTSIPWIVLLAVGPLDKLEVTALLAVEPPGRLEVTCAFVVGPLGMLEVTALLARDLSACSR